MALLSKTKVKRSNVPFAEGNQYTVLYLKYNKTNTKHTGVQIILAAMGEKISPVISLAHLYTLDLQLPNALIFCLSLFAFFCFNIVLALKTCISLVSLAQLDYSGYSFCKGDTQHVAD